jgi:Ca-activated chloride channel family protein
MRKWFCAAAFVAATMVSPGTAQEGATDTMIILDGSGSMWGVAGGQTKIASARSAVHTLLESWPPARKLGLMVYGHRRKGDCTDIETVAPVGAIDAAAIGKAVDDLSPKGKTPIADSLLKAASDLKSTESAATILLISDGIETCGGDPCAVAKALKESGVNFTAHVVGFDVTDPAAKAQLQCIADVSGGIYRDAADADGLKDALEETAGAQGGTAKKPEAAAEDDGMTLVARLRLGPDSDPLVGYTTAIGWSVKGAAGGDEVTGGVGAVLEKQVAAGDYVVHAEYGNATGEAKATVTEGKKTTVDVVLNAGRVVSEAAQAGIPGSASRDWGQLMWKVFKAGETDYLVYSYDPVPVFVLPEGSYVLRVEKDELATAEKSFEVKAGDELNVGLQLIAGTLKFSAPDSYIVFIDKAEPAGEQVAALDLREGEKAITPGNYVLRVTYRDGPDKTSSFTIKNGETTEVIVAP